MSILLMTLFSIAMYFYDPLHIFSNPNNLYSGKMRYQAVGYLNNKSVTGLIIGSSMLENTDQSEASKKLNESFINISLKGSSFAERKIILDYAFKKQKIKKLVYALEVLPVHFLNSQGMPWEKLYDNNPINDITVYYKFDYLKCLLTHSKKDKCVGRKTDINRPTEWMSDPMYVHSFNGVCSWPIPSKLYLYNNLKNYSKDTFHFKYDEKYLTNYTQNNILSLLDEHKSTDFFFVMPPYSAPFYKLIVKNDPDLLKWMDNYLKYFASECDKRKNCNLYGYSDMKFTTDLHYYKDSNHYKDTVNSLMIDSIKENTHRVTKDNLDAYIKSSLNVIESVDLGDIEKVISTCMK